MIAKLRRLWAERPKSVTVSVLILVSAGTIGAVRLTSRPPAVATAEVKLGEFVDSLEFRGEVKALKSVSITAPAEAGDLQIVKIATDGAQVKKGDVVVEFDKTKTEQDLAQNKSSLKSAQAEIEQSRAQARLTEEENVTAAMKARYDVSAAELEASKQEIVSKIEGEEAKLKLADARQRVREAEEKQKSDRAGAKATLESKIEASRKALYDVQRAERSLAKMTLRASTDGMISLVQLWRPEGQAAFRPGDRAWPGALLAELPDLSSLRVYARVDETERSRVQVGQSVNIQLDAIPDRQFTGHIKEISTIATADFSGGWPFPRNFRLEITLDESDSRLRPGMTSQLTIIVDRVPNAVTIPAQSLFQRSGRSVAYVLSGTKFEERVVQVSRRSADRVLVAKGLQAGEKVALKDPTVKE
ncbi:MAG TPA: efflux RND transporter periplasmic adaptor subunit [Terriglobales bacterium]|nr:efflux RND transporter periplasmic adaptor subunit [Terriglobales bacterium]